MSKRTSRREFFHLAGGAATGLVAGAQPAASAATPQAQPASRTSMGARFRALLQGPDPVLCVGAHDVLAEKNALPGAIQAKLTRNQELSDLARKYNFGR